MHFHSLGVAGVLDIKQLMKFFIRFYFFLLFKSQTLYVSCHLLFIHPTIVALAFNQYSEQLFCFCISTLAGHLIRHALLLPGWTPKWLSDLD